MDAEVQAEALRVSRARREEEWQKIRNPDVITEKDKEEDFETKTLYERLQENRELKRAEIEEQFRYKNMVYSGLDNDEHKFLEAWEETKKKETSDRMKMDIEELQKFKARIVDLGAKSSTVTQLATPVIAAKTGVVSRQKQLLTSAVKRKKSSGPAAADTTLSSAQPSSTAGGCLAGLMANYSDSDSSDGGNSGDQSKSRDKSRDRHSSSSSSNSGSDDSSDSSSSGSDGDNGSASSSGSGGHKRKKVRKPSWGEES